MNAAWIRKSRAGRNAQLLVLCLFILGLGIASCLYNNIQTGDESALQPVVDTDAGTVAIQPVQEEAAPEVAGAPPVLEDIITHQIQSGDNLTAIFDGLSIDPHVLYQILAADESLLALDVLHPGNRLTFTLDHMTCVLEKMVLYIHPGQQVVYRRIDNDTFEYEEVLTPGVWKRQLVSGEIIGSFYRSAVSAGLDEPDAGKIAELFKAKLNFSQDIRSGDHFQIVRREQFVGGQYTGQSYIEGVRIFNRDQTYTAFLFEDGNYYDKNGESLVSAFLRYPYRGHYRVSSSFSPKRRHPVTGRMSPHNGTDFSMSTGTSVLSTGDGIVTRVKDHPYAGKYIEIQHSGRYVTRYLHLSRILVKKGQKVKRGELIAKSGNTGRSTGPHLHFELLIGGRPVNPVTAKIPMAAAIPENKQQEFGIQCTALISLMETPPQQMAWSDTSAESTL